MKIFRIECNSDFDQFCKQNENSRHKTISYTFQQNGVVEIMNMTLLYKVRCMMICFRVFKTLCCKAAMTTLYIVNRTPFSALDCKTLVKVWTAKLADYYLMRTFGSSTFSHQNVEKIELRSHNCIFLGYPEGVKGCRLKG